jgi:hypothetical protein
MQQGKDLRAGRNHWTAARNACGASGVLGDGPVLNRRSMMKAVGLGAAAIAAPSLVAGCSSSGSGGSATRIVFEETKPEVGSVLQRPGREVQREPVACGGDARFHLQPDRGVRAR